MEISYGGWEGGNTTQFSSYLDFGGNALKFMESYLSDRTQYYNFTENECIVYWNVLGIWPINVLLFVVLTLSSLSWALLSQFIISLSLSYSNIINEIFYMQK